MGVLIVALVGAFSLAHRYRSAALSASELRIKNPAFPPPPEPVNFRETWGELPHRLCLRSESVVETTICDVTRAPELFASKCIQVAASFESDGHENSVLIDESCPAKGLTPWIADSAEKRRGVAAFDTAVSRQGLRGTKDTSITARFAGRFTWMPNALRPRNLEIDSVNNLIVHKRKAE